jgi:sulfite exporter TauE/SafE
MSLLAVVGSAGALGLLGGTHCIAMCSALQRVAVHGLPGASGPRAGAADGAAAGDPAADGARSAARVVPIVAIVSPERSVAIRPSGSGMAAPHASGLGHDLRFHAGRAIGYAALGAGAGMGSAVLRWGADFLPWMRPAWTVLNGMLLMLGLALLVLGRQPGWLDTLALRIWGNRGATHRMQGSRRPIVAGLSWALLPCGLLYTALATAAMASDAIGGALAMLAFAAGTSINLMGTRWLLDRMLKHSAARAQWLESAGTRVGGALLAALAIAALVAIVRGQPHPFC